MCQCGAAAEHASDGREYTLDESWLTALRLLKRLLENMLRLNLTQRGMGVQWEFMRCDWRVHQHYGDQWSDPSAMNQIRELRW